MPRNVRNAWVEVNTEDRRLATGPRSKTGGAEVIVKIRENAGISKTQIRVDVFPHGDYVHVKVREVVDGVYAKTVYENVFNR